ncbi:hypothetical protein CSB45_02690 [candidate division KSB3 bacterium]|uniref:Uncharacterized protein n=1 Tax=candidate division KSB3 bacterium TaxID=2044937 RepID=A0A2G6EA24_9BACT|nr:MAG: hypothetical protein CSB45_02690 [candidate division KSB3 bacterium]PIE30986.1 MAG: hypothetical protein CSA57_01305 [candidate division KSB3 bacterium]
MSKLGKTALKQQLAQRSKAQLLDEIVELFEKFSVVRDYYQAQFNPLDREQLLEKYKAVIHQEFFPERGTGKARRSVAQKAISDYKKVVGDPLGVADLLLYVVETGVQFTNAYGDMDEPFYTSMERIYHQAIQHLVKHGIQERFELRCHSILTQTRHVGWGFYDTMSEIFYGSFER